MYAYCRLDAEWISTTEGAADAKFKSIDRELNVNLTSQFRDKTRVGRGRRQIQTRHLECAVPHWHSFSCYPNAPLPQRSFVELATFYLDRYDVPNAIRAW